MTCNTDNKTIAKGDTIKVVMEGVVTYNGSSTWEIKLPDEGYFTIPKSLAKLVKKATPPEPVRVGTVIVSNLGDRYVGRKDGWHYLFSDGEFDNYATKWDDINHTVQTFRVAA